ncbi:TolC family protein [Pseudoalteromonas obscura]|uniref:TolC family protein n=1 Tax=Pseudoalteromonas obscura TaxID=3048491 RepID=A0ABT7EKN3_9GAMM|nr:TolC family protein [Pseudoalteromonas sp. P94(2023)]MDK2595603.1 TolC family protein [Pseudoalteromonas sp. P94(2023)]
MQFNLIYFYNPAIYLCSSRNVFVLLLVAANLLGASTAIAKEVNLTLKQAIDRALTHNISVQNQYLSRISDKVALETAEQEFEPQYLLTVGEQSNSVYSSTLAQHEQNMQTSVGGSIRLKNKLGGQLELNAVQQKSHYEGFEPQYGSTLTLAYKQPLLRGAGSKVAGASVRQAKWQELSQQLNMQQFLTEVIGQVVVQYRSYQLALHAMKISQHSFQRAQHQVQTNSALVEAGRLSHSEYVQSRAALANQKLALKRAENELDQARLLLLQTLRMEEHTHLNLTEPLAVSAPNLNLARLVTTGLKNRPDYLQAQLSVRSNNLNLSVAEDEQNWDLSLNLSYQLMGSEGHFNDSLAYQGHLNQGDYSIGLQVNIPIGDKSKRQSLYNAQISLYQSQNTLYELENKIRLELLNSKRNIETGWEALQLAKSYLTLTREQLSLEQEKLAAGLSSNFHVVSFETQLVDAENQFISAQISYLNLLTVLQAQLGTTLTAWQIKLEPESGISVNNMDAYRLTAGWHQAGGSGHE